jgi:hypothetical protein
MTMFAEVGVPGGGDIGGLDLVACPPPPVSGFIEAGLVGVSSWGRVGEGSVSMVCCSVPILSCSSGLGGEDSS